MPPEVSVCGDLSLGVRSEGNEVERLIASFVEFGLPQARGTKA